LLAKAKNVTVMVINTNFTRTQSSVVNFSLKSEQNPRTMRVRLALTRWGETPSIPNFCLAIFGLERLSPHH
jgi:hypothetical protein